MTITPEQVADLQPGDVVELRSEQWPDGTLITGPLWEDRGVLKVASAAVRWPDLEPYGASTRSLTVLSWTPRPLFTNHPRTEPVVGDVVTDEEAALPLTVFRVAGEDYSDPDRWIDQYGTERTYEHLSPPRRLRLLVDGETGRSFE